MAPIIRVGDLDIDQDLPFERREWVVHKLAWATLGLVVILGLLGLLGGNGPLCGRSVSMTGAPIPARVEYRRYARLDGHTNLTLRLPARDSSGEETVWLSRSFIEAVAVELITPRPREERAGGDQIVYLFDTEPGEGAVVCFRYKPRAPGALECLCGASDGTLRFTQWVYP
ncbi:MAG: hypothetical protein H7Y88_05685 [Phycisphaerales bacterium]|nr:hypothetical protein [Phycisphaerales bacterium]